jgi:preprotein translocase subunit SecG
MLSNILDISQVVLAVLMMVVILLQQKGSGMGAAFGGSSNVYNTKRGADKVLHNATIVMAVLFFLVSVVNLVV